MASEISFSTGRIMVEEDPALHRSYVERGVQRGGRRYSVGWSYLDRVWSAIQRKKVGVKRIKITCFDWRAGI